MTLAVVQGTLHYLAHLPLTSQYRSSYYYVQPKADISAAPSATYPVTVLSCKQDGCKKRWLRGFFGFFGGGEMAVSMIAGHVC